MTGNIRLNIELRVFVVEKETMDMIANKLNLEFGRSGSSKWLNIKTDKLDIILFEKCE